VASTLGNLAGSLAGIHQYDEAEALFLRARRILEQTFGETHPYYVAALNNLIEFYEGVGKHGEAEKLKDRVSQIRTEWGKHLH